MRVDNRVTQVPPLRTRKADHEATRRSPADNGHNRTLGELPQNPNCTRASAGGPSQGGHSAGGAGGSRTVVAHGDAGGGGSGGGSSSHGAERRAGGGGDRGGRGHADSHVTGVSCGGYDARRRIEEIRRKKSSTAGENDGFPTFFARLRNLLLPEKFKPLGSRSTMRSKIQYSGSDATPSPSRTLVATTTRSASTSLSAWTKLHLHGSSPSRGTRSTSGTSSRSSSPATSRAPWDTRVLAWPWPW
jgi:hypothetical protein